MIERFPSPSGDIRSLSLSPDGRFLAATGVGSGVIVYGLQSDAETTRLSVPLEGPRLVAFSPDRQTLAVTTDRDGRIVLWDLAARHVMLTLQAPGPVVSLAFSSDGRSLASGGLDTDSTIVVWDLDTGRSRRFSGRNRGPIVALAFSRNNRLPASASGHEREVRLWDIRSSEPAQSIDGHARGTTAVTFSPQQSTLATAGNDGMVRLWSVFSGRLEMAFDGDATAIGHVAYTADGRWLIATSRDDYDLRIWNLAEAELSP